MCSNSGVTAHDKNRVREGFTMDRTIEDIQAIAEWLGDDSGNIAKRPVS